LEKKVDVKETKEKDYFIFFKKNLRQELRGERGGHHGKRVGGARGGAG
jgi:hypothetical protein